MFIEVNDWAQYLCISTCFLVEFLNDMIKLVDQLVCMGVNFVTMFAYQYYYTNERQTPLGEMGVWDSKNIFLERLCCCMLLTDYCNVIYYT